MNMTDKSRAERITKNLHTSTPERTRCVPQAIEVKRMAHEGRERQMVRCSRHDWQPVWAACCHVDDHERPPRLCHPIAQSVVAGEVYCDECARGRMLPHQFRSLCQSCVIERWLVQEAKKAN